MREKRQHYLKDGPEKQEARKNKDMFCFESSHHENSLLNKLNEFYQSQTLCDVTLIAEGQKIKTHKAVLAACSPYFTTMFTTNLKESAQDVIELKDITFLSLQTLVTFCYTSSIEISAETVFELLTAADMLDFTVIKDSTSAFLSSKLTPSNCMEISVFADLHNCQTLRSYSLKYAQQNFRHVTRTEAFLEATYEQVEELLSSESLGITTEKDVFEALMVWVKHDTAKREKRLSSLFKHVRLHLLPPKEIVDCVEHEPLIENSSSCMKLVNAAKTHHLIPDWSVDNAPHEFQSRSLHKEAKIYLVGGEVHQKVFSSLEVYSMAKDNWEKLKGMNKQRDGVGVSTYDGKIYAVGGCDGQSALSCMEVYDLDSNQWQFRSSMHEARHALAVSELDGWLYALGGSNFTTAEYCSAERYDPVRDNWSFLPHMNAKREGLASVSLEGALYAMGGDNGVCILNTMERFDPRTGKWYFTSSMGFRRRYFGAAVLNGAIYALGGSDFDQDLNSIECFDPRANRWQFLPSMTTRRESVAVAALGDKILAIGGACMNKETSSVEVYDPVLNKWDIFAPMVNAKEGMGVVVL
ncbi:kelch-like protein diablo [Rhopilema esculentum]|uniref:kelch-like protein diablo n=1 Tax=Rhopilema esculentum TaxID=499914 RepID=UPI0031E466D2|eukprot:gene7820-13685_t